MADIHPARFVASCFAVLYFLVSSTASDAQTPLVIAELKAERMIARADADRAAARGELAAWKLHQLQELRDRGHASWQEVAQQEVIVKSATASAQAADQYLQGVIDRQAKLKALQSYPSVPESECIRLYMPGSPRLVAWISTDVAAAQLSMRHLDHLRAEHTSRLEIDLSPFEDAIKKAEREVDVCARPGHDTALRRRAEIRLRLARADYAMAKARQASANIVARRIAVADRCAKSSPPDSPASLGRVGTRFVDATCDGTLTRLVAAMATGETLASDQTAWLEQQRDDALTRIDALEQLSQSSPAVLDELDVAKKQLSALELEIDRARIELTVHQKIAGQYEQMIARQPSNILAESMNLDEVHLVDANAVRHSLELKQLELLTASGRTSIEAQRDYLVERLRRVEKIPQRARPPRELDHLRRQIGGIEQQLAAVDRELSLLGFEQRRLSQQLKSQHGQQYQLVQASGGKLVRREQFETTAALVAAVGWIGDAEQQQWNVKDSIIYPYFESDAILDCMSGLSIHPTAASAPSVGRDVGDFLNRRSTDRTMAPRCASGLSLATDAIADRSDLFCYVPYGSQRAPCDGWCTPRASLRTPIGCGFRTLNPYQKYPFGDCGMSIFSYRAGAPTRSSFPYRSNYLYRTAFPLETNLYSSPYTRPATYLSFGYPSLRDESCFFD